MAIPVLGSPRAGFVFLSALVLAGAVVGALVLRSGAGHELEPADVESTLRDRRLWVVCGASGLYVVPQVALMGFVVLFLHDARGFSTRRAAAVLAVSQVLAAGLRIGVGHWSDVLGSRVRPLRLIGVVVAALLVLVAVAATLDAWILVPVIAAATGLSMAWNGLSFTIAAEVGGRRSGAAIGIQQTVLAGPAWQFRWRSRLPSLRRRGRRPSAWRRCSRSRAGGSRLAPRQLSRGPGSYTRRVRILDRLEQLYEIGGGPGANRVHGTPEEDEALRARRRLDARGGARGRARPGRKPRRPLVARARVWTGSHLDSVPQGGRYDGALGVVAGLEAVERAGAGSVVVFRGEEVGCIGSRASSPREAPLPGPSSRCTSSRARLAQGDAPLGVVTAIVGYVRGELVFEGAPDTPARRRWPGARTRSWPRPRRCWRSAMPRGHRGRRRDRRARSTSSPEQRT